MLFLSERTKTLTLKTLYELFFPIYSFVILIYSLIAEAKDLFFIAEFLLSYLYVTLFNAYVINLKLNLYYIFLDCLAKYYSFLVLYYLH